MNTSLSLGDFHLLHSSASRLMARARVHAGSQWARRRYSTPLAEELTFRAARLAEQGMVVGAHAEGGWTLAIICCVWRMKFAWRGILEIAAKAVLTLAVEFSTCTPRAARLRDPASVVSAARPSASMQRGSTQQHLVWQRTRGLRVRSRAAGHTGEHVLLQLHTAAPAAGGPWAIPVAARQHDARTAAADALFSVPQCRSSVRKKHKDCSQNGTATVTAKPYGTTFPHGDPESTLAADRNSCATPTNNAEGAVWFA